MDKNDHLQAVRRDIAIIKYFVMASASIFMTLKIMEVYGAGWGNYKWLLNILSIFGSWAAVWYVASKIRE